MKGITENPLMRLALQAALEAGEKILQVYAQDFAVDYKSDYSPLTLADRLAHEAIQKRLEPSGILLISEEGDSLSYTERALHRQVWIVDPLDGTKEFVKRNGEFTVNIALIEEGYPVLGVVYAPVSGRLYAGDQETGLYVALWHNDTVPSLAELSSLLKKIEPRPRPEGQIRIVASRSHMSEETAAFIREKEKQYGKVELLSMGSSLKICLVAEGLADIYPRFAPTMEWDTAAGQAVAEAAGKSVKTYPSGRRMQYNRENQLNGWFVVE